VAPKVRIGLLFGMIVAILSGLVIYFGYRPKQPLWEETRQGVNIKIYLVMVTPRGLYFKHGVFRRVMTPEDRPSEEQTETFTALADCTPDAPVMRIRFDSGEDAVYDQARIASGDYARADALSLEVWWYLCNGEAKGF
jgi:hypothetical protein